MGMMLAAFEVLVIPLSNSFSMHFFNDEDSLTALILNTAVDA